LLDEMISPKVARELRANGYEVQAIAGDRPELRATPDVEIVRRIHGEQRSIVTNNVKDFEPIHRRFMAQGEDHSGIVFTWDASLPRNRAGIPLWVETLGKLLRDHPTDGALRNRVKHLP
jgi:predicted nuclease of predicted toxin-antitoxin system